MFGGSGHKCSCAQGCIVLQRNGCYINSDINIGNILLKTVDNLQEGNASVKHISSTDVELILEKNSVQKDLKYEQNIATKFTLIKQDQEIVSISGG